MKKSKKLPTSPGHRSQSYSYLTVNGPFNYSKVPVLDRHGVDRGMLYRSSLYTNTALSTSRDAAAFISRSPRGGSDGNCCDGSSPASAASSVSGTDTDTSPVSERPAGAFCRRSAKRPVDNPWRAVTVTAGSCDGRSYAGGAVSDFAVASVALHVSGLAPVGCWAVSALLTMATAVLEGTR